MQIQWWEHFNKSITSGARMSRKPHTCGQTMVTDFQRFQQPGEGYRVAGRFSVERFRVWRTFLGNFGYRREVKDWSWRCGWWMDPHKGLHSALLFHFVWLIKIQLELNKLFQLNNVDGKFNINPINWSYFVL